MTDYLPIFTLVVLVVVFVAVSFPVSTFLAPRRSTRAKTAPYECGIVPEVEPAERFPVGFYLVALTFIILDVEVVFLYPFTIVYRGLGGYGLAAMGFFLVLLLVPFAYLLSTGALAWGSVRQVAERVIRPVLRTREVPKLVEPTGSAGDAEGEAA
ncbi:MAG: NADH-quinone oxidoreductase subunit A [Acidimicrobiia bacterium]|nr:NADH-quinone oxidoreductase subunit A [Acidimicrobiia bacterium]